MLIWYTSEFQPNMHTFIFNGCLRAVNESSETKQERPSEAYNHYHFIIMQVSDVPRIKQNIKWNPVLLTKVTAEIKLQMKGRT